MKWMVWAHLLLKRWLLKIFLLIPSTLVAEHLVDINTLINWIAISDDYIYLSSIPNDDDLHTALSLAEFRGVKIASGPFDKIFTGQEIYKQSITDFSQITLITEKKNTKLIPKDNSPYFIETEPPSSELKQIKEKLILLFSRHKKESDPKNKEPEAKQTSQLIKAPPFKTQTKKITTLKKTTKIAKKPEISRTLPKLPKWLSNP